MNVQRHALLYNWKATEAAKVDHTPEYRFQCNLGLLHIHFRGCRETSRVKNKINEVFSSKYAYLPN